VSPRQLAARAWGALPGDGWKTHLLARLGPCFLVSVWAIVLDQHGRILLFRHTHDRAHPWGLPSGRLETCEQPEEALRREFSEEVGGRISPIRLVTALREPGTPALRLVYTCSVEAPPAVTSAEVDAWRYVELDQLPQSVRPLQRTAIATAIAE
jgi:ADP-ribose pyrophosphatase YjhB (NUDIX family)